MKKDPLVLVNWTMFGEWCIRDYIRREERLARKQSQDLGSLSTLIAIIVIRFAVYPKKYGALGCGKYL